MAVEIYMPKMSDHMESGKIVRWLVGEGEAVERGQVILELETDKVTAELEAPEAGVLVGVRVPEGLEVPVGETIAFIARTADEKIPSLPSLVGNGGGEAPAAITPPSPLPVELTAGGIVPATPVARRVAKELGVDIAQIMGSGPGGRVKEEDVRAYAATQAAPAPAAPAPAPVPAAAPAPAAPLAQTDETMALSSIQAITGQRMVESFNTAPHFYLQVAVDMTHALEAVEATRAAIQAETGERVSVTALLIRAAAVALQKYPRANAAFENGRIRLFPQANIGVAVGAEEGLVVPVIRDAGAKSLAQITRELKAFQAKAKAMKFSLDDLAGGTFTLSNLGMYGVDVFSAIINPPQSAILAVGRIIKTPVGMPDDTIDLRPMMTMTLSIDHRALDGMQGARFLALIKELVEQPYLLI